MNNTTNEAKRDLVEHTQGEKKWEVHPESFIHGTSIFSFEIQDEKQTVCTVYFTTGEATKAKERAEFICKAVNNYDRLVKSNLDLVAALQGVLDDDGYGTELGSGWHEKIQSALQNNNS